MAQEKGFKYPVPGPIELKKVSASVYSVTGGMGANSYFITGKTGVVVIDAKMTEEHGRAVVEEIKKITALPVTRMIITHSDLDHVNGLSGFPRGMAVTSSKNTRSEMALEFEKSGLAALIPYLPNDTFDSEKELDLDGEKIKLFHVGSAHTGGDTIIFLPDQRIVFAGDLVTIGRPPLIHVRKGGSSSGLVKNLEFILKLDCDTILSGHSAPAGKKEVETLMKSVESTRQKVIALKKQGKSLEQIKKELNVVELEMPPGRPRFPSLEEVVYGEQIL
jgi:glyoxylase-like metal-dependent hydrolase (beta-lactamase superfamily II)